MTPLIRLVSTLIFPAAVLIALSHVLYAESGPGDGFTAGIITALALTLQYESFGYGKVPLVRRSIHFQRILAVGLVAIISAALLPLLFGAPVMGTLSADVPLPLGIGLTLSSAKLFDLGLALAVFGGSMTAIDSLRRSDSGNEEDS